MTGYEELRGQAEVWPGVINRGYVIDTEFQEGSFLADYATKGRWAKVLQMLRPDNHLININQAWPGDGSWSTVLHRAAELGAPHDVVEALLGRGALRSLRNGDGRTAHEIARQAGHGPARLDLLRPQPSPFGAEESARLDAIVADVIDHYIRPVFGGHHDLRRILRYPPVQVLHEPPGQELWMQVPVMSGGFRIMLRDGHVELLGGYRRFDDAVVQVTTHRFVITTSGSELVDQSCTRIE
jgi:hypothetical protein